MPGVMLKKFGGHMRRRADPASAEIDLTRTGLGHGDDVGDRMRRERGIGDQRERRGAGQRHSGKIFGRIERDRLAIKDRGDCENGLGAHHERVAVGRRLRHVGRCDHAARAGAVLHNDGLAEAVGHFRREDSRNYIGAAAGAEADEKLDRPIRIACRLCRHGAGPADQREHESQSGAPSGRHSLKLSHRPSWI
jgi:hypothetical protein